MNIKDIEKETEDLLEKLREITKGKTGYAIMAAIGILQDETKQMVIEKAMVAGVPHE